ncbi:MAG: tetratricopeptide repeat protein [Chitinophagales bacterium]
MRSNNFLLIGFFITCHLGFGQKNPVFERLPVGKYAVGFKILTIFDDSRMDRPEFNYLGEKNEGDRRRKITMHIWYPAVANTGKKRLVYADYCYNERLSNSSELIAESLKNGQLESERRSVENWFGKSTDGAWDSLIRAPMLAEMEAEPIKEKMPLLIGMLRSISTSITNEMLASNGYVVVMVRGNGAGSFALSALNDIPDMQHAIQWLNGKENINDRIGSFGFSGSGFSQVLFAMHESRVNALADIESGIYMEGLFQGLSASNYYNPAKLRVPFLHIFSLDLSKREKYIDEFEKKSKFDQRYRLILNQHGLHHWDFAAEGYTACIFLNNRGAEKEHIRQSFEIASNYLLQFLNAILKKEPDAMHLLSDRSLLKGFASSLWDIRYYPALKPVPSREELDYIIRTRGIETAMDILNKTLPNDSSSDIMQWFVLNPMGYLYLNEGMYKEAIAIFSLNIRLHPNDANLFDSLAEGYERSGDKENMKQASSNVLGLLLKKSALTDSEKALQSNAEKRLSNSN